MEAPEILFSGKVKKEDIILSTESINDSVIPLSLQNEIDEAWKRSLEDATRQCKMMWDSEQYRLSSFEYINNKLYLTLSVIPFRVGFVLRNYPEILNRCNQFKINSLAAFGIIKTKDDKYILGKASGKYTGVEGRLKLIGGGFNKSEHEIHGPDDFFIAFLKELKEEIGIGESGVENIYLNTIIKNAYSQITMGFFVQLNLSSKEVFEKFKRSNDEELSSIIFFSKEEFLRNMRDMVGYDEVYSQLVPIII